MEQVWLDIVNWVTNVVTNETFLGISIPTILGWIAFAIGMFVKTKRIVTTLTSKSKSDDEKIAQLQGEIQSLSEQLKQLAKDINKNIATNQLAYRNSSLSASTKEQIEKIYSGETEVDDVATTVDKAQEVIAQEEIIAEDTPALNEIESEANGNEEDSAISLG